jgi:hypothetical protein
MPKFVKSSPELVARFDATAARFPEAERRRSVRADARQADEGLRDPADRRRG